MSKPIGAIPFYGCHILPVPLHGEGRSYVNPHKHDEDHDMVVLEGDVEINVHDTRQEGDDWVSNVTFRAVRAPGAVRIPAGTTHSVALKSERAMIWCVFK
jgi:hypothetical protein